MKVARVVLPVAAGRNLAVLLEAAVRSTIPQAARHRLHQEFIDRQARALHAEEAYRATEPPALAARRRRLLRSIALQQPTGRP